MSSNDYVKYVTEQFVKYVDTSKEERKSLKKQRKLEKEPMLVRMFGILPFALLFFIRHRKKRK